jgi:hypothetical protein
VLRNRGRLRRKGVGYITEHGMSVAFHLPITRNVNGIPACYIKTEFKEIIWSLLGNREPAEIPRAVQGFEIGRLFTLALKCRLNICERD